MKSKILLISIILLTLCPVSTFATIDDPGKEVDHNLYIKTLGECPDCKTFTIIIADKPVRKDITNSFKKIAESFGKKHAGAMMTWNKALEEYRFFKDNHCSPLTTSLSKQTVVFIDTSDKYCQSFPYDDEQQLYFMLEHISRNLENTKAIKDQQFLFTTKKAIADYAKQNVITKSLQNMLYIFIDYIDHNLNKK